MALSEGGLPACLMARLVLRGAQLTIPNMASLNQAMSNLALFEDSHALLAANIRRCNECDPVYSPLTDILRQ